MSAGTEKMVLMLVNTAKGMEGQGIALARMQIQELLWELKELQGRIGTPIRFSLLCFDERTRWVIRSRLVDALEDCPRLAVVNCRRAAYTEMLEELERNIVGGWPWPAKSASELYLVLVTDGAPKAPVAKLAGAMQKLKSNPAFIGQRCRRYVLMERIDPEQMRWSVANWPNREFVSREEDLFHADDFPELLFRLKMDMKEHTRNRL